MNEIIDDTRDGWKARWEALDRLTMARIIQLAEEINRLEKMCDALLNHCDKENGECSECGRIVCPHHDPFHFHHDGCPSCAEDDE